MQKGAFTKVVIHFVNLENVSFCDVAFLSTLTSVLLFLFYSVIPEKSVSLEFSYKEEILF